MDNKKKDSLVSENIETVIKKESLDDILLHDEDENMLKGQFEEEDIIEDLDEVNEFDGMDENDI